MIRISKKTIVILFMCIFWLNLLIQPAYAIQPQEDIPSEEINDFQGMFEQFTGGKSLDEMLREEEHGEIEIKVQKKKNESDFKARFKEFFKETKSGFLKSAVQFIKDNIFCIFLIIILYVTLKIRETKQQKRGEYRNE